MGSRSGIAADVHSLPAVILSVLSFVIGWQCDIDSSTRSLPHPYRERQLPRTAGNVSRTSTSPRRYYLTGKLVWPAMFYLPHFATAVGMRRGQWAIHPATDDAYLFPWGATWAVRTHEGRPTRTQLLLDLPANTARRERNFSCKIDQKRKIPRSSYVL